jgi:TadE-like protein
MSKGTTPPRRHGRARRAAQNGAAMVESLIALPILLAIITAAVQFGLIYRAKATVNHATLQAARAGAVSNADLQAMQRGLAGGLLPLYAPDDGLVGAIAEVARDVTLNSSVRILNPTREAFADFSENLTIDNRVERAIPNDALERRPTTTGSRSGLNIQDANLLRVEVRYGFELSVPVAGRLITTVTRFANLARGQVDPFEQLMLAQGRLPIVATSTVRMQTPAKMSSAVAARASLANPARVAPTGKEPARR